MTPGDKHFVASGSQTIGPFFHVGPAASDRLAVIAHAGVDGERLSLRVVVLDGDQHPVSDALVEIWQADAAGRYVTTTDPAGAPPTFAGFGRLGTDEAGACVFETIRPGRFTDEAGVRQAPHLNVLVFARGLLRHLYTRAYFEGDPALSDDPLLSLVPADRRSTLLARPSADGALWEFVVRLQGDQETVFFDV